MSTIMPRQVFVFGFALLGLAGPLALAPAAMAQTTTPYTDTLYEYRLGAGDKVKVTVFGDPDLSGEFVVSGEGTVSLPLIGDQKAAGLTATELQRSIEAALMQGYLKEPRVNIEMTTFRPFYILGEVNAPGEFAFSNGLTVMNAVARSGGFTYRAEKRKVFIKSANSETETEVKLNSNTLVKPGDTIRITERYF